MRYELLELSDRLVFGLRENLLMIFRSQVGLQTVDRTEVDLTTGDHVEHDGETPSGACRADALTSRRFRHMVADHEKVEQRGMPESGPQPPLIDGVDVAEQNGVTFVVPPNELTELVEQRAVVESIERKCAGHELLLTRVLETPVRALRRRAVNVVRCSPHVGPQPRFRRQFDSTFDGVPPERLSRGSATLEFRQANSS